MKGFKDSTRAKYECGGRVAKQAGGAIMPPAAAAPRVAGKPAPQMPAGKPAAPRVAGKPAKPVMRKADGGAVSRANRAQAEEAREGQKLMREVPARPTRGNNPRYTDEPAEARAARAAPRATPRATPRAERAEASRGPAGSGFRVQPMYEVNTGPSPSGQRVLRGLEGAARAALPASAERGLENMGILPRGMRGPRSPR